MDRVNCRVSHERSSRRFREIMQEAAAYASDPGKDRLINVPHSGAGWGLVGSYVVTVRYWDR